MRKSLFVATMAAAAIAVGTVSVQAQPYGPGMMGGGYGGPGWMMSGYGPGMMGGSGYGPGWMHGWGGGGYGPAYGMMGGGGYGPGWMHGGGGAGYGMGPGMMYGWGYGNEGNLNLTTDQVKTYLQRMIRNPNLKVGDVREKDADTIVAEIVTKQGNSLVQKLDFNRHSGFVQPEQ
jgi:hypothetical protein